ncbi:hypothetical protein SAMN03159338_3452 [Sphingomonas sp. NFR04]|uniref:hypothetical protein n=1 Tax=Sphingomonas sp. NFR04 TaxID=1566283 RepID=UPI0008F32AA3|nr:hypothetical protein [Sphingomonas sp. NFR04]SFK16225.1 hypothetical protein SAMN03159338_3452 [Sphingomonas sp. NFR04]
MKQCQTPLRPRAALLISAAFLATPAFAQEVAPQQTVTPPPAVEAPAPQAATPAPEVRMAPAAPVVQSVPSVEQQMAGSANQAPSTTDAAPARTARAERSAPRAEARAAAQPRPSAPAAQPASAPTQQAAIPAPAPVAQPQAAEPAAQPAAPAADVTQTTETTTQTTRSTSLVPWILGGLAVILAVAAAMFLLRRRRTDDDLLVRETATTTEPVAARPIAQPVAPRSDIGLAAATAAPVMAPVADRQPIAEPVAEAHVEAKLAEADEAVLEHVVDAPAPVANRPWLELGLRPVRAGTSEEEALVDIELTVGNSGDTPARDVRISTFLLADVEASEMEQLLTGHGPAADVPPVTIDAGDGTRVDAHLAVPKGELGRTFTPVVVAEARYRLPDGREGRTSAAFRIGRAAPAANGVGPIGATRPHLVEDLEAELLGTPAHA